MSDFEFDNFAAAVNYLKYLSRNIGFKPHHRKDGIPVHGNILPAEFVRHVQDLRATGRAFDDVREKALLAYADGLAQTMQREGAE